MAALTASADLSVQIGVNHPIMPIHMILANFSLAFIASCLLLGGHDIMVNFRMSLPITLLISKCA